MLKSFNLGVFNGILCVVVVLVILAVYQRLLPLSVGIIVTIGDVAISVLSGFQIAKWKKEDTSGDS